MGSGEAALARCSVHGEAVVPHWFTERDHPWILALLEEYLAFVGEPRRRLDERLAARGGGPAAGEGREVVAQVLDRLFPARAAAPAPPRRVRALLFRAAAGRRPRAAVLAAAAAEMGLPVEALEESLLADVPGERRLQAPATPVHAAAVALQANLAMVQAALKRSSRVAVTLEGHARAIVRHATLRGLICTARRASPAAPVSLEVSGPLALFRRTALYGRHLAELVPLLAWSRDFRLEAHCTVRGRDGRLVLGPADPLPPSAAPRPYDSRLEQRFARDFTRLTGDWELVREPEPVAVRGTFVFPDFAIVDRRRRARRWLLEIMGFWTADYVEQKLRRLRAAGLRRLILCLDARRDCGAGEFPPGCSVLRFERRIDPRDVLAILEGRTGGR